MRTIFAAALAASANALYEGLIKVDDSNYNDLVLNDKENIWVLTFYADWCPYAQALEHEILVNSRNMAVGGYKVKYGAVDVKACPELVDRYQIKRSPTIEIYGEDKMHPRRYGGVRTHEALDAYMMEECKYASNEKSYVQEGAKEVYDIEACEADMDAAQEERLMGYE